MIVNLRYRLLLTAGALLLLQSPASALCFRSFNFHMTSEGPWNGYGTVNQGKTCRGNYAAGGTTTFRRLLLIQAPAHGTIRLREGGTFVYTAPKGYSGADAFTLRVCGKADTTEGCANIIYHMTVM
jgi:hypothetical protein